MVKIRDARPNDDAEYVPFGASFGLPDRYSATAEPDDADLPLCHLEIALEGGRPVCVGMLLERRGAPLSGQILRRLRIGDYVREATGHLTMLRGPRVEDPQSIHLKDDDGSPMFVPSVELSDGSLGIPAAAMQRHGGFNDAYRRGKGEPHRQGRLTDEDLKEVAAIYRAAYARGEPPTNAVAREMFVARSTAGRWVTKARERGFLGKARARSAGEARPT